MTTRFCLACHGPVHDEMWGSWCSLLCAHSSLWRQRAERVEPEPTRPTVERRP